MNEEINNTTDQNTYYLLLAGLLGSVILSILALLLIIDVINAGEDLYKWLMFAGRILFICGLIGLSMLRLQNILVGYFVFDMVLIAFTTFSNPAFSMEMVILYNIILVIPYLWIYSNYFNISFDTYAKGAFVSRIFSVLLIVLRVILWEIYGAIGSYDLYPIFRDVSDILGLLRNILLLIEGILVAYWLYKIVQGTAILKEPQVQRMVAPSSSGSMSSTPQPMSRQSYSEEGIELPIIGKFAGMPMLDFWCTSCNQQKKVNTRNWKDQDYGTPHSCPQCNNTLKVWYRPPTKNTLYKFLFGLFILAGGVMTSVIEGNFGSYGLQPAMIIFPLAILELVIGAIMMYSSTKMNYTGPPSFASDTVPPVDNSQVMNAIIIFTAMGLLGGFIIWGLNIQILHIILGY